MAFSLFWSMVIMKNLGIKCYILSYSVKVSEAVAIVQRWYNRYWSRSSDMIREETRHPTIRSIFSLRQRPISHYMYRIMAYHTEFRTILENT